MFFMAHKVVCLGHNDLVFFWQQFGSKLCYVCQWALKISRQPRSSPRCRPTTVYSMQWGQIFLHVATDTFLHISHKPPLQSSTWPYRQKANEKTFPTMSCLSRNTDNFSHESNTLLLNNAPLKQSGKNCKAPPQKKILPSTCSTLTPI